MKIVFFSDTHGLHQEVNIPECDLLLFTGDFSMTGEPQKVESFLKWLTMQPAKHVVYIAGNHDLSYENYPDFKEHMVRKYSTLHYLEDSLITLCGLNIYGSPYTPQFYNWAFMLNAQAIKKKWRMIPQNTDILITHGPPYGILDTVDQYSSFTSTLYKKSAGCPSLLKAVEKIRPKIHAFGHIHQQNIQSIEGDGIKYINGAICDDDYIARYKPVMVTY